MHVSVMDDYNILEHDPVHSGEISVITCGRERGERERQTDREERETERQTER